MDRLTLPTNQRSRLSNCYLQMKGLRWRSDFFSDAPSWFSFDMNLFFQALLSRFLREYLQGYAVQDQYNMDGMMSYDPAHNPRKRQAPTLRPDYMVRRQAKIVAILDAKYRDLWENRLPDYICISSPFTRSANREALMRLYFTQRCNLMRKKHALSFAILYIAQVRLMLFCPVNLHRLDELIASPKRRGWRGNEPVLLSGWSFEHRSGNILNC